MKHLCCSSSKIPIIPPSIGELLRIVSTVTHYTTAQYTTVHYSSSPSVVQPIFPTIVFTIILFDARRTTGPEIWHQTDGCVDVFVSGMGTGGTLTGTSQVMREERRGEISQRKKSRGRGRGRRRKK
jgi:hypothetical protein